MLTSHEADTLHAGISQLIRRYLPRVADDDVSKLASMAVVMMDGWLRREGKRRRDQDPSGPDTWLNGEEQKADG